MFFANTLTYLARQSIYDREGNLFAYELLFRDSMSTEAVIQDDLFATMQVLENSQSDPDFLKTLGEHKVFVNCSREALLSEIPMKLDSKRFVLEILENVAADEAVLKVVRECHARGLEFALDDVVFTPEKIKEQEAFFPYVTYAKMDLILNSAEARAASVSFFKEKGIRVLAEKVETEKEYRDCLREGFNYFQGFFLAKPELIIGQKTEIEAFVETEGSV
ncbi:MAG: EAL domain-containing protein [Fibrobacter sp.]|jgi:EAL and modified HD-GYP domain-containing signal transduction protein|nr:EAL domain-containing protein [Fibrobacter sp.]